MSNMAVDVFARTLALASLGNGGGGSAVDTYTKAEINKMFSEAGTVQVEAVDALPTEDIKENVIYLVPNGSSGNNFYDECMYINGKWETIGTTEIDMSQYSTTEELQEMMLQELAKYITNADFTEALKDYATKKYVDDTVGAIEIPSIEGLATEEYADAAGQKAFDDMAAIAGDVNSLTTETHETFAAAINEINAKVDGIGNQIVISSIEPLDATKDPNLINNYITQEELKEFHTRILNGGSGKIIFQGAVEDVTYVSHYVPQYPSPSMFFYCVNNYIGTPSTDDGATVYKEKYAPAFVLIYTEQTDTYSWGRTSQTSIEVPSVEGLATEEYVNEKIEEIAFTPNWNAQEGEEGYIENRTHYSNFTTSEVIYHPNSASFGLAAGNNGTYWFVHEINDPDTIAKISTADKISINFLGTVVEGLEKKSKIVEEVEGQPQEGELITVYWFGNDYAFSAFSPVEGMQDTGEPVSILVDTSAILLCLRGTADDKGKTMFGTCVIEAVTESVKKLDNKYLDLDAYSTKEYVDAAIAASSSNVEVFEGTQEEYDALSDEEKAKYTIVVIDDGEEV